MIQLKAMLSLKDSFTSPLGKAQDALDNFEKTTKTTRDANGRLRDEFGRFVGGSKGYRSSMVGLTGVAGALSTALANVGAGMVAMNSVNLAMDFESQMSSIGALTGLAGKEMQQMTDLALEMGAKTKYSALEAAQGMEELLKAGISPATVKSGGLEAALNLATAGGLELADAAEIMSTSLNAFKDDGMEASEAANILAGAANASATSVGELKYGLSQVATVASGIGFSFEDTNSALAVFAQNGLKGSDAGTSLKTMIANLIPDTKKTNELFMDLGLVLEDGTNRFFDASGKVKSMAQVAGILQKSLKGMTNEQRQATLQTMFGSDAVRAGNIMFKEGAEGVKKMQKEMANVTALEVAKEKMNNASGAIEQMSGAFETMQIVIGTAALPAIKDIALWMADLLEKMQQSSVMDGITNALKTFGSVLVALKVPLLITGAVVAFTLALAGIGAVLGVVVSPIGAVVAGIALFATGLAYAYKHSETFRNAITAVGTTIKGLFAIFSGDTAGGTKLLESIGLSQSTITTITNVIAAVKTTVFAGLGAVKSFFMAQFTTIKTFMDTNGPAIFTAVQNAFKVFAAVFSVLWPVIKILVIGTWDAIKNIISGALKVIMGVVNIFTGLFTGNFSRMWKGVKQVFFGAIQAVWGYINLMFVGRILKAGRGLFVGLKSVVSAGWGAVKGFFSRGIKTSGDYVVNGWAKIKSFFSGGVDAIKSKVSTGFGNVTRTISEKLGTAKDKVIEWGQSLPGKLFDAFKNRISTLASIGTLVWNQIKSTLPSVGSIVDYVSDMIGGSDSGGGGGKKRKGHYSGLYNVPNHGYQATLHSGESVLTANQSAVLRNSGVLTRRNGNLADVNPYAATASGAGNSSSNIAGRSVTINMNDVTIREEADVKRLAREIITMIDEHDDRNR